MRSFAVALGLGVLVNSVAGAITWSECDDVIKDIVGLKTTSRRLQDEGDAFIPAHVKTLLEESSSPDTSSVVPVKFSRVTRPEIGTGVQDRSEQDAENARRHLRSLLESGQVELHCGTAPVLRNPRGTPPGDETINMSVYRVRKKAAPDGGHTHYWALQGGPGGPGLSLLFVMSDAIKNEFGSVVYIPDHRGTGKSDTLRCDGQFFDELSKYQITLSEIDSCLDNEPEAPLASVTNAAHDVVTLMKDEKAAESPKEVRLHGYSYGTMWAQRIMQIDSTVADKVVLEGVTSKDFHFNKFGLGSEDAGKRFLTTICAKDQSCNEMFPNGINSVKDIIEKDIIENGEKNECLEVFDFIADANGLTRSELVQGLLYIGLTFGRSMNDMETEDTADDEVVADFRAVMLAAIGRVARCDPRKDDLNVAFYILFFFSSEARESSPNDLTLEQQYTQIMQYSTNPIVYDMIRFSEIWDNNYSLTEHQSDHANLVFGSSNEYGYLVAEEYEGRTYEEDIYETEYFVKDAETNILVVNGDIDGQTPMESAHATFLGMTVAPGKHKRFAVIPGAGHGATVKGCGLSTIKNFFQDAAQSVPGCAIDETEYEDYDNAATEVIQPIPSTSSFQSFARLVGTNEMWNGGYRGCAAAETATTCGSGIKACDACFVVCTFTSTDGCECFTKLATCLNKVGCSNSWCKDRYTALKSTCNDDAESACTASSGIPVAAVLGGVLSFFVIAALLLYFAKSNNEANAMVPVAQPAVPAPDVEANKHDSA